VVYEVFSCAFKETCGRNHEVLFLRFSDYNSDNSVPVTQSSKSIHDFLSELFSHILSVLLTLRLKTVSIGRRWYYAYVSLELKLGALFTQPIWKRRKQNSQNANFQKDY